MKIDTFLVDGLATAPSQARRAEEIGFDAVWTGEVAHDPLLPLAAASVATARIQLGSAITLAFARSPMSVAYQAWDLASASQGRFILGLGTQVKAHIARRFAMPWHKPLPRELLDAARLLRVAPSELMLVAAHRRTSTAPAQPASELHLSLAHWSTDPAHPYTKIQVRTCRPSICTSWRSK